MSRAFHNVERIRARFDAQAQRGLESRREEAVRSRREEIAKTARDHVAHARETMGEEADVYLLELRRALRSQRPKLRRAHVEERERVFGGGRG